MFLGCWTVYTAHTVKTIASNLVELHHATHTSASATNKCLFAKDLSVGLCTLLITWMCCNIYYRSRKQCNICPFTPFVCM